MMIHLIKRKYIVFILCFLFVLPDSSFAQPNGLLDGKTLIRSSQIGSMTNASTHREATDNSVNSYVPLYTNGSAWGYKLWHEFSTPVSITSYYLSSDMGGQRLALYDSNKNELFTKSMSSGVKESFKQVDNVRYAALINTTSYSPKIYEFDVFYNQPNDGNPPEDPPPVDPSPVDNKFENIGPGLMPWSDKIPSLGYSPDINQIFRNFQVNWTTLSPATTLLYGILLAFFIAKIVKSRFGGD